MKKRFLFFAEQAYSFEILRPLQDEIRRRGHEVRWLLEPCCENRLRHDELSVASVTEACRYNPDAVFVPGDWVYPRIPGVKVNVCHGYPIFKRGAHNLSQYRIRGYFDIYCTSGPSSTPVYQRLAAEKGFFAVYETGWVKADAIVAAAAAATPTDASERPPRIFVASTFTEGISRMHDFYDVVERLSLSEPWQWVVTHHPMLRDADLDARFERLASQRDNVTYLRATSGPEVMAQTDAMLCDASSIINEYAMMDKPVVTLCNTYPGPHLINVLTPQEIDGALRRALSRPPELMEAVRNYVAQHEAHMQGNNSAAILDAVDDFMAHRAERAPRRKPLNLFRRLKMRLREWRMFPRPESRR